MKNMKKFAALLLTAAMTVAMVGCGSSVAANTVNSKDDLPGKKIGVQLGTTGDADATAYEDEGSTVERYNKGSDAIQALKTGKIDCVIIDKQPAEAFVEKNDDLKILDDTFDAEEYAICIAKDNTDLTDEFNKAIEELKADGTIDTIISNYIGDEIGQTDHQRAFADPDPVSGRGRRKRESALLPEGKDGIHPVHPTAKSTEQRSYQSGFQ